MKHKSAHISVFALSIILIISTLTASSDAQNRVDWKELAEAQIASIDSSKVVFVFVEAEWCGFCKRMKRDVFPKSKISDLMRDEYFSVLIDLESKNELTFNGETMTEREFARNMEVKQTPTMIFLNSKGKELGRQPGYLDEEVFYKLLRYVISDEFGVVSFSEYSADG
jgi:thioredoxin-related protein